MKHVQPDVVIGFEALLQRWWSAWLRIPLLIHEQNAVMGLPNRILSRLRGIFYLVF